MDLDEPKLELYFNLINFMDFYIFCGYYHLQIIYSIIFYIFSSSVHITTVLSSNLSFDSSKFIGWFAQKTAHQS